VIGPSKPVISIGPILALPGMREALVSAPGPVVAVSPLVRGAVLKGPTDAFMAWAGMPLDSDGIAGRLRRAARRARGRCADRRAPDARDGRRDGGRRGRERLARETLDFALALAR
jgi:LPPG:FO 2-phospho-L-lactate transferase